MVLLRRSTPIQYDLCGSSSDVELSSPTRPTAERTPQTDATAHALVRDHRLPDNKDSLQGSKLVPHVDLPASKSMPVKPAIMDKNRRQPPNRVTFKEPSPKRIKSANEHPPLVGLNRSTLPYVKPMSTDDTSSKPLNKPTISITSTPGDVVQDSLNTVTKVIVDLGQKLIDTENALKESMQNSGRLEREQAADRQLQRVRDARIVRLEQELKSEKAKCLVLEEAQKKLDQIQALCGGLVVTGGTGLKRESEK